MIFFITHCKKMKFSVKDFLSKYDQIYHFLRIWSHLLKKPLMQDSIFCAVNQIIQPHSSRTDTNEALGFTLSEKVFNGLKPILMRECCLLNAESRNYVTNNELLGIFCAVEKCKYYLINHNFFVYTDHKPLLYLSSFVGTKFLKFHVFLDLPRNLICVNCKNLMIHKI